MTRRVTTATCALIFAFAFVLDAAPASALSPWWHLTSGSAPTYLAPGVGRVVVTATNLGDEDANGQTSPVMIRDRLSRGLTALEVTATAGSSLETLPEPECSLASESLVLCSFEQSLAPYDQIRVVIRVRVAAGASSTNEVSVSGGGAPSASLKRRLTLSEAPTPFGVEDDELSLEEAGGAPDTRAGSHPFQLTTTLALNQTSGEEPEPAALPKDLNFKLPAGLIGNPTVIPRCTLAQFSAHVSQCAPQTAVGAATVTFNEPGTVGIQTWTKAVYNLEPNIGEPARFGFRPTRESAVFIDTSVRTGGDYGVTASVRNITQQVGFLSSTVTLWGVPGAAAHDRARGESCLDEARQIEPESGEPCRPLEESNPPPFLALPTSCPRNASGQPEPLSTSVEGDSWSHAGDFQSFPGEPMPAMDDCNQLPFSPRIDVALDGTAASSPTGLDVDVHVDQESILDSESLAESAVKDITVTLPEGVQVNPAGAGGLGACSEGEIGFAGEEYAGGPLLFTATKPEPFCPGAAKIGTVEIVSPLLPADQHLKGAVYLASQNENPFGSLVAMYIVAEDPISGVLVKLPGEVRLGESGQIITTFKDTPQLAFEDAKLEFFGGERAPLARPAHCRAYTTTASFVPWAAEPWDEAAVTIPASSTFEITSGPNGTPCPGASLPFSPSLTGGSPNINAGAFSPLTTTIGREDGQQNLQSVQLHMPAGLEGLVSKVTPGPEAQANEGTCGAESLIGETTVSAGVGSDPVSVTGGKVYITEKYDGAPFGLSIVNPVKAGPFDLERDTSNPAQDPPCDCIVVRARIEVNPLSAELTVTTDPSGRYAIPHLIDGIPVQIKKVNVTVDRPDFTFNPTNCDPLAMTGTITGDEGASALLSVPFQITNCAVLKFTPTFTVATTGKASKRDGAGLTFKISYPKGAMATQSWFEEAKFDIPRQLPARLETIQQACLAVVFEKDRTSCPAHSVIGHAVVRTPVLPVPLEGPVYFVSYGGARFPEAVLVLQGDNVTVELHGETFIDNKTGVTSATFTGTPDVPFESIAVTLPTGPYSEFGVNLPAKDHYDLCGHKLVMPTLFKAQNGLEIHQNTSVAITGCPKAKPKNKKDTKAKKANIRWQRSRT